MRKTALVLALALAGGPLAAQQPPDSVTLVRARAALHHDPFAVAGWPIVSVSVRPCWLHWVANEWNCSFNEIRNATFLDTVVVVQQRQDTVTLELTQWWDRYSLIRPETTRERLEPRADQTVEHVWMMLRGPLPRRARDMLLGHLVQIAWTPAGLRSN
jgi:hypothetical protein